MHKVISEKTNGLVGTLKIPGDKSISHRALILGSVARGTTEINGLLESEDVLNTAKALQKLGTLIRKTDEGLWIVQSNRLFKQPDSVIDMGNSGTGVRLLMGVLAAYPIRVELTGDASLRSRPMKRITDPLSETGAVFETTNGKLPIVMQGYADDRAFSYTMPVASAQLKSALLLAGLRKKQTTTVYEPVACRDHTERMLKAFGADITVEKNKDNVNVITLRGGNTLKACSVFVPEEIS